MFWQAGSISCDAWMLIRLRKHQLIYGHTRSRTIGVWSGTGSGLPTDGKLSEELDRRFELPAICRYIIYQQTHPDWIK